MFSKCKVCAEKDLRIADLQKQVDILHTLVFPAKLDHKQAFIESLEANKIMGADSDSVEIRFSDDYSEADQREAESLFNGDYDQHIDFG